MRQKNILLILTDQHRWDYIGYSGMGNVCTPNIDRIARGMSFSCCQTSNPICQPARASLFTGRYSHQIQMLAMSGDLPQTVRTLPQALQQAGYYTAYAGKLHLLQPWAWSTPERTRALDLVKLKPQIMKYGFDRLWESAGKQLMLRNYCDYSAYLDSKGLLESYPDSVQAAGGNLTTPDYPEDQGLPSVVPEEDYVDVVTCDRMIDFLDERPDDRPFFACCSFCSPHKPFDPPQRYLDMVPYEEKDDFIPGPDGQTLSDGDKRQLYRKIRAYKAMILLIDDQVGRLLDWLEQAGFDNDTVVMFTSDHGEMLGNHFRIQKEIFYKESSTVPLAIYHPDHTSGGVCAAPIELTDVTATILDAAGLDPQAALQNNWPAFNKEIPAKSLMPVLRGDETGVRDFSFTECNGQWQMLQTEKMKYVKWLKTPSPNVIKEDLYDLENDPAELINIIEEARYTEVLEWFRRRRAYLLDVTQTAQTAWAEINS